MSGLWDGDKRVAADRSIVAAIGECMIEIVRAPDGTTSFGYAGDTLNTSVYLARLGLRPSYVTALGTDPFSDAMLAFWTTEGVASELVTRRPDQLPGLYIVTTDQAGERRFHYWRDDWQRGPCSRCPRMMPNSLRSMAFPCSIGRAFRWRSCVRRRAPVCSIGWRGFGRRERSQHKNRSRAMSLLKARLLASEREKQQTQQAQSRKLQVGSGDRSERIRTYNFPQGRVTDHRINLTLYKLDDVMNGHLDELIGALNQEHQAEELAQQVE